MEQHNKLSFPRGQQYTKTVNEKEVSKDSILSDVNSTANKKLFTPSKETNQFSDNNAFGASFKGGLIANMTASNISIPSSKTQQNNQFFGNRNNKNSKFNSDVLKNPKHLETNGSNSRKANQPQAFEVEQK